MVGVLNSLHRESKKRDTVRIFALSEALVKPKHTNASSFLCKKTSSIVAVTENGGGLTR